MVSNDLGDYGYPAGPSARWPAADIAASWRRELPGVRTPAQFTAFVERERKLYADLVKRSGATVD